MNGMYAIFVAFLIFAPGVYSLCSEGGGVVVYFREKSFAHSHSKYFDSLAKNSFCLTFINNFDEFALFTKYSHNYDNVILFLTSNKELEDFKSNLVYKFLNSAVNLQIILGDAINAELKSLLATVGLEFQNTQILDYHVYNSSDARHEVLIVDGSLEFDSILKQDEHRNILYRGSYLMMNPKKVNQRLMFPALLSSQTSHPQSMAALVVGFQTTTNARVVVSASYHLFSNEYFDSPVHYPTGLKLDFSGNRKFAMDIAKWNFKRFCVLRSSPLVLKLAGTDIVVNSTTRLQNVTASCKIEQFVDEKWVPYVAKNIVFELVRIEPFIRLPMTSDENGEYSVTFVTPNSYGIFTAKIRHDNFGYTNFIDHKKFTNYDFKYDHVDRFTYSSNPYYASSFSMMVGVILLSFIIYLK